MVISTLVKRASRPASAIRSDTTIAIVASSHLATDILIGAFGATLPYLQQRFGLSGPQVAVLAAVLAATSSFGQPLAGRLADRVGPRDLAAGGAVVASTLLGLTASTGALTHAGLPILLAVAQDRFSGAVGSASGLLMGLPIGIAAVLFIPLAAAVELWPGGPSRSCRARPPASRLHQPTHAPPGRDALVRDGLGRCGLLLRWDPSRCDRGMNPAA